MPELIIGFEHGDRTPLYVILRLKEQLDALLKRGEISAYAIEIVAGRDEYGGLRSLVLETKEGAKEAKKE